MAQKSITSFFSKAPAKPLSSSAEVKDNIIKEIKAEQDDSCSPVKNGNKGSKRLRIESDSESNSPPGKRNSNQSALKSPKKEIDSNKTTVSINGKSPKNSTPKSAQVSKKSPRASKKPAEKKKDTKTPSQVTKKKSPLPKTIEKNDADKNVSGKGKIGGDDKDLEVKASSIDCNDDEEEKKDVKVKKNLKQKDLTSSDDESNSKDTKKKPNSKKGVKKQAIFSDDDDDDNDKTKKSDTNESDEDDIVMKKNVKKRAISSSDEDTAKKSPQKKAVKKADKMNSPKEIKESSPVKKPQGFQNFFTSTKNKDSNDTKKSASDGVNYNPSKTNYHPIDDAFWSRGDKVPYLALAKTLEEIEKISARLKIVEVLSNFFRSVMLLTPEDLLPSVYLCLNKLAPAYESMELGIAEFTLMKAVAQSTGRSLAQIKSDCNTTGDLGLVAEQSRTNQRMMFQPAPLNIRVVFEKLKEIAKMTGHSSMSKKVDKIQSMFVACRFSESRYIIRSLAGKLRIGLAEQSVLQALAQACTTTPPLATQGEKWPPKIINASKGLSAEQFKAAIEEKALILKTTYCECPNYDKIIPVVLEHGIGELPNHCKLTPGVPLKPMLAHPTKGVHEVLQRFENVEFTCEWKYDGERAQIHVPSSCDDDGVISANISGASIYSRNQENNTSKYPDILGRLSNTLKPSVHSCVLDCEAVAWDKEKKQILPFQILSTRKRKDANEADIKVAVCIFMFDLLYLNGEPLVKKPFEERRKLLRENFNLVEDCDEVFLYKQILLMTMNRKGDEECIQIWLPDEPLLLSLAYLQKAGEWHTATSLDCSTTESIQEFLEESIRGNCEGLMVKTLNGKDATYEIAKRSRNWLKLKKDYLDGIGDTIDAVVLGGYLGRGKRAGVYGGFLLACHDRQSEEYQTLCKIGTGFSDEDLQTHSKTLKEHIIDAPKNYYRFDSTLEPDHWFAPAQVWEIKCADLSLSPVHMAALGIVHSEKGISLRFPRFIRVRDDKTPEEATSAQQVADMYSNQDQVKNQTGGSKNVEDDFY